MTDRPPSTRFDRRLARVDESLWSFVVPVTVACWMVARFLPDPASLPASGAEATLGRLAAQAPVVVGAIVFVAVAFVGRTLRDRILADADAEDDRTDDESPGRTVLWIVAAALVAFVGREAFVAPYHVTTGSMLPTLEPGDVVAGFRSAYGLALPVGRRVGATQPARGDVIVFDNRSGVGPDGPMVKRVIGLPGDRIRMQGGIPIVDDRAVPTCDAGYYVHVAPGFESRGRLLLESLGGVVYPTVHLPFDRAFTGTYVVRPGEVFVLGDNRNNSLDSRAWNGGRGGGLPLERIVARVDRVLVGSSESGPSEVDRILARVDSIGPLRGFDPAELRVGIARCVARLRRAPGGTSTHAASHGSSRTETGS